MAGVYIHIPYCRQICHYCDFYHTAALSSKPGLLEALRGEMAAREQEITEPVTTLYFGGGTPSVCSPEEIRDLIESATEVWQVDRWEEITLEANPDDLTPGYLSALREAGVNRLSMGIQSFHDEHLALLNRRHTAGDAVRAFREARQSGFDNIALDLMYGLPFMTIGQWEENLDRMVELGPEHISAYHLTIEPNTVFGRKGIESVDEQTGDEHFRLLRDRLTAAGYEHYEVSNFARPGRRSRHNSAYWSGAPYLGIGPSAHSYDGLLTRRWNPASIRDYLSGTGRIEEELTGRDRWNEYLMTRLRTADGIRWDDLLERFGPERKAWLLGKTDRCEGLLVLNETGVVIPPEKFLLSDYVIARLFE